MVKKLKIPIRIKATVSTPYYTCWCGRRITPVTNPSRCPYCGRITTLKRR